MREAMSREAMEGIYLLMAYLVVEEKWFCWADAVGSVALG